MAATPCPFCAQLSVDLDRLETELQFLIEGLPMVAEGSAEHQRVKGEFHRVEAALDRLDLDYEAHCQASLQHRMETRVALN